MLGSVLGSLVLSTALALAAQGSKQVTAQGDMEPQHPAVSAPYNAPEAGPGTQDGAPPAKAAAKPVKEPLDLMAKAKEYKVKLYAKIAAGVLYGGGVALLVVTVPVVFAGLTLLGLSVGMGSGVMAAGAAVFVVGGLVGAVGVLALLGGVVAGIPVTVLQLMDPENAKADESVLQMVLPRTIML